MSATVGIANWGPLVIGWDIDQKIISTLKTWYPTYVRNFNIERELPFNLATPRFYGVSFSGQEFFDHHLPAVVALTTMATATRGGQNRSYEGTFTLTLSTVVRGKNPPSTRWLASLYEGLQRRLILQKARGDPVNDMHYLGFRYEQVPDATESGRYCLAATSLFEVYCDQIVQPFAGPDIPDADEYVDEATVTEVDITVLGSPITITS
jgi:hypothetical protein